MNYIGDFTEDFATLNFKFLTTEITGNSASVPITLVGGVLSVYKNSSLVQSTAGLTLTIDFDGITGLNNVLIDLSSDAFYEVNEEYQVVITTGTVGGNSTVGRVVGSFSIQNRSIERVTNIVSNIPTGAAASSVAPETAVITTGSEVNTYTAAASLDGGYHEVSDVGGVIDFYYQFDVGDSQIGTSVAMNGRLEGKDDVITVQAYNWNTSSWVGIGTMIGSSVGSPDGVAVFTTTNDMTGTGVNENKVRIRGLASGLTGATFFIDRAVMRYTSQIVQSVGYANGQIWINTIDGTPGTELYVNGTADNPVDTLADAFTISADIGLNRFHMSPTSDISFLSSRIGEVWSGQGWVLDLGGQDLSKTHISHADVSGICTSPTGEMHIDNSHVGAISVGGLAHFSDCKFTNTMTITVASDYILENCISEVAGAANPTIDMGGVAVGASNVVLRKWHGGITIDNLAAGDIVTLDGMFGTITLNGSDAQVEIRGTAKTVVNNLTGSPTVNDSTIKSYIIDELTSQGDTNEALLTTIASYIDTEISTIISNLATVDTVVDGIQTDLSNSTDGLGALKALIDTLDTVADAVKAKTDQLTFTKALELDTNTQSINGSTVVGDGKITPWEGT